MSHIQIKNLEGADETIIFFPVSQNGLGLDDLRSAFPYITSLRYEDNNDGRQHHILCREKQFEEPVGGWTKNGRIYLAVGSSVSHGNSRFGIFNSYRRQIRTSEKTGQSSSTEKRKEPDTMITVGHGHFKAGVFSRISATSLSTCGGLVVVGPFSKTGHTSKEIKTAAYEKFCFQNRAFKQKYKSCDQLILLYPDGSLVDLLPDKKDKFSILGYKNFIDPRKRFDRLRLYLCDKDDYELNQPYEIVTDSSSGEEMPCLSQPRRGRRMQQNENDDADDDTLPLVIEVTFCYKDIVIKENFPNNTKTDVLQDFICKELKITVPIQMKIGETDPSGDDTLMSMASHGGKVNITIEETNRREHEDGNEVVLSEDSIMADFTNKTHNVADNIVNYTLTQTENIEDPLDVLKTFQSNFLRGRQLDVRNAEDLIDDNSTTSIFVSRQELFKDAVQEILHPNNNLRWPLHVTFYGEHGNDLGGPRLEFFRLFLEKMKETILDEDKLRRSPDEIAKHTYYACGLISGLSVIQGGPCVPNIHTLVNDNEEGAQFRLGLQKVGIWQLIQRKATFQYLFHDNGNKLSAARLLHILEPKFHEPGTNARIAEERTYSLFIKYVRNVAAGRRGSINLGNILAFVTGADREPIMGFTSSPSIKFAELRNFLPTASTCTKELYLPINGSSEEEIFERFDLAFVNDYFGLV